MKVLVAGATGAIGQPLVSQLLVAGHEVVALTRSEPSATKLRESGAQAVVCDVFDATAVDVAMNESRPDAVIDQLTSLPQELDPRKMAEAYAVNDKVRSLGTEALVSAAKKHGVKRYIVQSIAFIYAPSGEGLKSEDDAAWIAAPEPFTNSVRVLVENERKVTTASEFTGIVLRYGFFYGPGTWYASDGSSAKMVEKRQFPIAGGGHGVNSFVHVADAAAATVAALTQGDAGIYNIVDDEPAEIRAWAPVYAAAIGAKPPRKVPLWLARIVAGKLIAQMATQLRGASNAKAKTELGWQPQIASWREGFVKYRDSLPG
ncbi:MAG: NAD-dependent epimerase/dehydratase family protein [Solirubrobacterales bacterium]